MHSFLRLDVHEQVSREQREDYLHSLPVLPFSYGFIGREKRFNVAGFEVPECGLFMLGNRENCIPGPIIRSVIFIRI